MTWSRFRRAFNAAPLCVCRRVILFLTVAALIFAAPSAKATLNNGENAIDVIGQTSAPSTDTTLVYTKDCYNNGASLIGFNGPTAAAFDTVHHRLFISDNLNNRVLVFPLNTDNTLASKTPANVLGQPDFDSCEVNERNIPTWNPTQSSMTTPNGLAYDGTNDLLYVADTNNSRVLVFNTASITNGMNAAYVLGQTGFTVGNCNWTNPGNVTQNGLCQPFGLAFDAANSLLYVSDESNNRVLAFTTAFLSNGENASYELGQPSGGGTDYTTNGSATSQSGMNVPQGLALDTANSRLFVSDANNNRVLMFSTLSLSNGENATYELGQPSGGGTEFTTNSGTESQSGLDFPQGLAYDSTNSRLFVSDFNNRREMVFNVAPGTLSNGEDASTVLGQPDFVTSNYGPSQQDCMSVGVAYDATNSLLYCLDSQYSRVDIFNINPTVPTPSSPSQGGQDACAIASGALYCWGANYDGEVGTGEVNVYGYPSYDTPVQIGTATNWTVVSQFSTSYVGDPATCGIAGGALYCWGNNTNGELGLGNTAQYTTPQQVGTDTNWTAISTSGNDTCGIDNGALYCWGLNAHGELGLGNTTQYTTPQQVGSATNWSVVSVGLADTCGVEGGSLYCWGQNSYGEDGLGDSAQHIVVGRVGLATNWTAISQGSYASCGIAGGSLYCWGSNSGGELGLGNTTSYWAPQQVGSATNWSAVSIQNSNNANNDYAACGIAGGALYCWGQNNWGNLGLGNTTSYNTPQQVGSATNWTSVSYAGTDACGVSGNQLYCWGLNNNAEDGVDTYTQNNSPQVVAVDTIGNGENATDLLGQYNSLTSTASVDWYKGGSNNGPTALGFFWPFGVTLDPVNHHLFVAEQREASRVLVYNLNTDNSIPTTSGGHTASYVIGNTDFIGDCNSCSSAQNPGNPLAAAVDNVNNRLFVTGYCSVFVFNSANVISTGMSASNIIGATDISADGICGTTQSTLLYDIHDVAFDPVNNRLFVADSDNNRVLVFNTSSISFGMNASYVLGQPDFVSGNINQGGSIGPTTMYDPTGLAFDATNERLFVLDASNNRVLVFNVAPGAIANDENAFYVLGEPDFVTSTCAYPPTQNGLCTGGYTGFGSVSYDPNNNRLFVADGVNQRVMVFNVAPSVIANGENASYEIGATNFTSNGGAGAPSQNAFSGYVSYVYYDPGSGRLFASDVSGNRVLVVRSKFYGEQPVDAGV